MIEIRDKKAKTFPIDPMIEMLRRDKYLGKCDRSI